MTALAALARWISLVNRVVGEVASWLSLGVVLVCFAVVVLRYAAGTGFVWMQDLYVWMNGIMFTAAAGYTFLKDGHVRVDIFYRPASLRRKAWADLIGFFVFLVPFIAVVIVWSWPYVTGSWAIAEESRNAGGLHGLYVVKSFLIVFAGLVLLQGVAVVCRSILILGGRDDLVPDLIKYEGS